MLRTPPHRGVPPTVFRPSPTPMFLTVQPHPHIEEVPHCGGSMSGTPHSHQDVWDPRGGALREGLCLDAALGAEGQVINQEADGGRHHLG